MAKHFAGQRTATRGLAAVLLRQARHLAPVDARGGADAADAAVRQQLSMGLVGRVHKGLLQHFLHFGKRHATRHRQVGQWRQQAGQRVAQRLLF
jgi:hypothetical protein